MPTVIRDNGKWKVGQKISDFVKDSNTITKFTNLCSSQLVLGKNVYLSNIHQREIQKQPKVMIYEEISWADAKKRFSKWDRWSYVEETKGKQPASAIDAVVVTTQNGATSSVSVGVWGSDSNYWNLRKPDAML